MLDDRFVLSCILRLSIVLVAGWGLLAITKFRDPRWSVATTRLMIAACLLLPVLGVALPSTSLPLLPTGSNNTLSVAPQTLDHRSTELADKTSGESLDSDRSSTPHTHNVGAADLPPATEPSIRDATAAAMPQAFVESNQTTAASAEVSSIELADTARRVCYTLWFSIAALLATRTLIQIVVTHRLVARSRPLSETELGCIAEARKETTNVRVSCEVDSPCTAGLIRPLILLPASWLENRSRRQMQAILSHEQAHIDSRDLAWDLLARFASAVWWFHPFVWFLRKQHRLACELASDAIAADSVDDFMLYRRWLAQWTLSQQSTSHHLRNAAGTFAMAERSLMMRRLRWLKEGKSSVRFTRPQHLAMLLIAGLALAATASLHFSETVVAQSPQTDTAAQAATDSTDAASDEASTPKVIGGSIKKAQIDLTKVKAMTVRIIDTNGNPIAGAAVALGQWVDSKGGSILLSMDNPLRTDGIGEVGFAAPSGAIKASFWVRADGYQEQSSLVPTDDVVTIQMERGKRLRLRVVDPSGNPVSSAVAILENAPRWPTEFEAVEGAPGVFLSPSIKPNRRALFVASESIGPDGKPTYQYSDWLDAANPKQTDPDGTIVATVRPGVRLRGRLDDTVPRPIKFGFVELCVTESLDGSHQLKVGSRWRDVAEIQPDGSFEFPSVPRGQFAQIFALTEGYMSKPPTDEQLRSYMRDGGLNDDAIKEQFSTLRRAYLPRFVPLEGKDSVEIDSPIPCEASAAVQVRVVDPNGAPIENAKVSVNPNGRFIGADVFIAGTSMMVDTARFSGSGGFTSDENSPATKRYKWAQNSYLSAITDAKGLAHIRNLPPRVREGYHVVADGYVMPVHPTTAQVSSDLSELDQKSHHRYAAVELISGETQRRTVTMERYIARASRELNLTTSDGDPIAGVNVTVAELAFKDAPNDWQSWSVARFGEMASGDSGKDGVVRLVIPTEAEGKTIDGIRVAVSGRAATGGFVQRQYVALPAVADGGVLRLTPIEPASDDNRPKPDLHADYVNSKEVFSKSPRALLNRFVKSPSIALLRQLLQANKFDDANPLKLRGDRNLLTKYGGPANKVFAVIPTADGDRVVVLADVRPKGATWDQRPWSGFPPEAAFVFRADTGELTKMIGGWISTSQNTANVMLFNMGGSTDYFVQASGFEKHPPFEMRTHWYLLGDESKPALTTYNYANATSWFGKAGVSDPPGEFGYMMYEFNGRDIDYWLPGHTATGVAVPRKIYWDAGAKTFVAPATQAYGNERLYRIVPEQSSHFEPFEPKAGQMIVAGGRTENSDDYHWEIVIPAGRTGKLSLHQIDDVNSPNAASELQTTEMTEGLRLLQVRLKSVKDATEVSLRVNSDGKRDDKKLTVPRVSVSDSSGIDGWRPVRSSEKPLELLQFPMNDGKAALQLRLELQ